MRLAQILLGYISSDLTTLHRRCEVRATRPSPDLAGLDDSVEVLRSDVGPRVERLTKILVSHNYSFVVFLL